MSGANRPIEISYIQKRRLFSAVQRTEKLHAYQLEETLTTEPISPAKQNSSVSLVNRSGKEREREREREAERENIVENFEKDTGHLHTR